MIRIEDLTFTYPGAGQETLSHISLHVEKGDFLAVIGNNGCGKSTLCKALNGLIPHFIAGDMTGRVVVGGLDTTENDVGSLAEKVGYDEPNYFSYVFKKRFGVSPSQFRK